MMTNDILYLKISRNNEVCKHDIYLCDVAKMECSNKNVVNRLKVMKILTILDQKHNRYIFSVLKVIEQIHEIYPQLEVKSVGEPDFIIDFEEKRNQNKLLSTGKIVFVCLTIFFGSAFTIMTFNNDVGVSTVFKQAYEYFTGNTSDGFTILELSYSIGLPIGILIFYNHFGGKKITTDPTPIEVEMRLYEDDINTTLIEGCNRKESNIDVD